MSRPRYFRPCTICGTPGHPRGAGCPVREYNAQLEKRNADRITAASLFPGRPDVVLLLEATQRNFAEGLKALRARA